MKSGMLLVVMTMGLWASVAGAQDPNCVAPVWECPAGVDPNVIRGYLLPLDPASWAVPCGKVNREGTCCDPDGDPYDIVCVQSTSAPTVTCNWEKGTWSFAVDVVPGLNLWVLEVTDRPLYSEPKTRTVTVICNGIAPPNTSPVLK